MAVYPNPMQQSFNVHMELASPPDRLIVSLIDMDGRVVSELANLSNLPAGSRKIALQIPNHLANGSYLLRLQSEEEQSAVKVVLE